MSEPRLAIIGLGKMGKAVARLAPERGWAVVAAFDAADRDGGITITRESLSGADVAVEFTEPAAAPANIRACVSAGCAVVVGTTGWYDRLPAIAADVEGAGGALLWSPNFSIGVNLFLRIVAETGRIMSASDAFDAQVVETHHVAKKDAPSGTAEAVARAVAGGLGRPVPISSIRTGHVPGTHELVFDAPFEQIRLEHVARDRRVFADGALTAARWLLGRRGVFTMADVIGDVRGIP